MGDFTEWEYELWYTQVVLRSMSMPVTINGQTYYRTAEVCRMVGISRNTLFRWSKAGIFNEVEYRDWRGWRLFTRVQIDKMKAKTHQISAADYRKGST